MAVQVHHTRFGADGFAWDSSRDALRCAWLLARDKLRRAGVPTASCACVEAGVWVTDLGVLWSTRGPTAVPLLLQNRRGYLRAGVYRGGVRHWVYAHRAVAEAFHWPPPPGQELVCHIDGDSLNNRAENLRWGDAKDNANDRTRHELERALWQAHGLTLPAYDPMTLGLDDDDYYGLVWDMAGAARKERR